MSYIRCLSNPESLYIWGGFDRRVTINVGADTLNFTMPNHVFHGVMIRWLKGREPVRYRGASLEEVRVPRLDARGKKIKSNALTRKLLGEQFEMDSKWRLTYVDPLRDPADRISMVDMWQVTLFYIASDVASRLSEE